MKSNIINFYILLVKLDFILTGWRVIAHGKPEVTAKKTETAPLSFINSLLDAEDVEDIPGC